MPKWFYRMTGGRPMTLVRFLFTDVVSGKPVYFWRDAFNNPWMANGPWSLFRVRPMYGPEIWDR